MTFLAPWALAIGTLGAIGLILFHLVALTRPAAYVLPTARFIPDQRSLVSRVASRPRDLLLLLLRVLLLLAASAAFARPVLTPSRGTVGHIVLVDRSRAVANMRDVVAMARTLVPAGAPAVVIAFDSASAVLPVGAWDSLARMPRVEATGSLTAAFVAARRASVALSERVDSVQLHLVSPVAASERDAATLRSRAAWPGAVDVHSTALRADTGVSWGLAHALPLSDPLGPATTQRMPGPAGPASRVVRGALSASDSVFARAGGTTVRWDTATMARMAVEGLSVGDDVIVARLGRLPVTDRGRVAARWADGTPAAVEEILGAGCVRHVGVLIPSSGDLPLHPPFQRLARGLMAPCGFHGAEVAMNSSAVAALSGSSSRLASAGDLRAMNDHASPLARWLLAAALLLAIAELGVRSRGKAEVAA